MNSLIKLDAKELINRNTSKLFFVSFFSFFIRYLLLTSTAFSAYFIYKSSVFNGLLDNYTVQTRIVFSLCIVTSLFLCLVFMSAVKKGENFIYFSIAEGGIVKFSYLFKYLKPSLSFRAFYLSLSIYFFKLIWTIYLSIPLFISIYGFLVLSKSPDFTEIQGIIMTVGIAIITGLLFVMLKISFARYNYCDYLFAVNPKAKLKDKIKKSIRLTDPTLTDGVILEYSFAGWILSCVFIIPIFYVVPYFKLSKALFISYIAHDRETIHSRYAVNILKILPN